jgi:hypothetical protein
MRRGFIKCTIVQLPLILSVSPLYSSGNGALHGRHHIVSRYKQKVRLSDAGGATNGMTKQGSRAGIAGVWWVRRTLSYVVNRNGHELGQCQLE